ncbi:PaaI family thioesterase [Cupriavidus necator]|uniref:PaaI family thioesterase n=1 Tax=Cupriavidus necator TaxID=106590 RepID=A0A1U9UR33_CUPNE|nr:PaaI family thioesterase [Cupriavidus necator]AQV94711.1 PaaI family thioesterase [Cupriavidus necator]
MAEANPIPADAEADADSAVPAGFVPVLSGSGYMNSFGTFYVHPERRIVGARVGDGHLNGLGIAHGGMLATLADTAIGMIMMVEDKHGTPGVTATLSIDYLSAASPGDWVEAHVELDKMGSRLRFAGCRLMVGDRCVLKASAVFAVMPAHRDGHLADNRPGGDRNARTWLESLSHF